MTFIDEKTLDYGPVSAGLMGTVRLLTIPDILEETDRK